MILHITYPDWKTAFDSGEYTFGFQVYRMAPGIGAVLADLIRRGELPFGQYLIGVDW